jgi:hypothetical protein
MVYLVAYELRQKKKNYVGLFEQLKNSPGWAHYLGSTWLISTNEQPKDLHKRLSAHLDKNDYILISQFSNNYYGTLPEDAWEWIRNQGFY